MCDRCAHALMHIQRMVLRTAEYLRVHRNLFNVQCKDACASRAGVLDDGRHDGRQLRLAADRRDHAARGASRRRPGFSWMLRNAAPTRPLAACREHAAELHLSCTHVLGL